MLEIPEAHTIANQLACIYGKKITSSVAGYTPNKFAWYSDDPEKYPALLNGKTIQSAEAVGGMVKINIEDMALVFSDGVNLSYFSAPVKLPKKHQLLINFEDGSVLSASIQMYGGLLYQKEKELDNKYYLLSKEKPSPLSKKFSESYFSSIISKDDVQKLSVKALLATEQRIPGLGNGVLQDILFTAKVHPRKKISSVSENEKKALFQSIKITLKKMTEQGGRDTEKNLFGQPGEYLTICSRINAGNPCPVCKSPIQKANYMGGSIYFCEKCQKIS